MKGSNPPQLLLLILGLVQLFSVGQSTSSCNLQHMLQCMNEVEHVRLRFRHRLNHCQETVCPDGDVPNTESVSNKYQIHWEQEDMLSRLFVQEDINKPQPVLVNEDKEMCSTDYVAAYELTSGILLPFSGCDFDADTAECMCNARLPTTGIYVAVDKNRKPHTRRLAETKYLKGSVAADKGAQPEVHNVWMEGANRIALIVLSTMAFIGNFIFLVQVFWVA